MSIGAILNQKQEVDLTGYLQQSDVVNTVTQGSQSPVSSGAVYTAIQQSQSGGLNWTLLGSGLNNVTFTVPDNMEFLKIEVTGEVYNCDLIQVILPRPYDDTNTTSFQLLYTSDKHTIADFIGYLITGVEKKYTESADWNHFYYSYIFTDYTGSRNQCELGAIGQPITIRVYTQSDVQNLTISVYYM